jgi:hypothetical protein
MRLFKTCTLSLAVTVVLFGLLGAAGCKKDDTMNAEGTVESTTPQGEASTTTSEVEQAGSTLTATSETEVKTEGGTTKSEMEAVVGTVTEYKAGKKLEVLTGESDKHSYDLNDKDVTVSIDGNLKVGSKVTVTETKSDDGKRVVTVRVEAT